MDTQLVRLYRQYMQQVQTLTYPSGKLLLLPYVQDQLYKHFFNGPLKGPPAYQRNVLKRIIAMIERYIEDVDEDVGFVTNSSASTWIRDLCFTSCY